MDDSVAHGSAPRPPRLTALLARPWLFHVSFLQPLMIWIAWAQWRGLTAGLLNHRVVIAPDHLEGTGVLEFWVHGTQPWFDWVPFIHPPGYTVFMNISAAFAEFFGGFEQAIFQQIFWQGLLCKLAVMALLHWALGRWKGSGWGLLAAVLYGLSPNTLRPFEHYPLASLLSAFALVALVEWAQHWDRVRRRTAIVAVLVAVLLHLSIWFLVGGLVAGLFFLIPQRRREVAVAALMMIGLFFLTTYPGLYRVLAGGPGDQESPVAGTLTLEWTNPALLLCSFCVFLPWLWSQRVGLALGCSVLLFAGVTLGLQFLQVADGQPYPFSLHYFELAEPTMVVSSVWGLASLRGLESTRLRSTAGLLTAGLLVSQVGFFIYCQKWVFLNIHWFWMLLNPFGGL
jgi:hypothetical protein